MGTLLLVLLMLVVAAMLAYSVYLLTLIFKAYRRLKHLTRQRDFELMLYAALPGSSVDEMAMLIPDGTDLRPLGGALERFATQNEGELREKALELYRKTGLYETRLREAEKGRPKVRESARRELESMGFPVPAGDSVEEAPAEEGRG